jgi:1-acyl-sn-glycerol-3-phosphate acyltransferase
LPLPLAWRFRYMRLWNISVVWLAWCICGVKFRLHGREHLAALTNQPCVILAKHQSQWETFYLLALFSPVTIVLKKELLKIPFFGWGLKILEPIAIDRTNPRESLRMIAEQGKARLAQGLNVLVFPEGTRIPFGEIGKYTRSGADAAIASCVPVLPLAHNAGKYWPAKKFLKLPGTIDVFIGEPIATSEKTSSRELTEQVKTWIEAQLASVD